LNDRYQKNKMAKHPTTEDKAAHKEWLRKTHEDRLRSIGRAISPNEKRAVMNRLLKVWEKVPELRLGQLIENVMSSDSRKMDDIFNIEDRILADAAEEFLKKRGK
jgi:hypothetical protein